MRRRKYRILILTFILLLMSLISFVKSSIFNTNKNPKIFNISVITRSSNSEIYGRVKQGILRAAEENNININFIGLENKDNVSEQIEILKSEINSNVDGIIIFPIEYEKIKEEVKKNKKKIPVVALENNLGLEDNYIGSDNYKIGYKLGDEVISRGNIRKNITLLESKQKVDIEEERKKGFFDSMDTTKNNIVIKKVSEKKEVLMEEIKELLTKEKEEIIVTFDTEVLEVVGKIKESHLNESNNEIYGVGTTNFLISCLEKRIIKGLTVQSDFNIGYLGVKMVMDLIENQKVESKIIDMRVINFENMYLDYNQKIIFPFS